MPDVRRQRPMVEKGPPASYPEGDPQGAPWDHSFTLQAVMQMQKDLGILGEKIDRMREDHADAKADGAKTRDKLADVEKSIASAQGALKVFGPLYALLLVVIAAFLAWFLRPVPVTPLSAVTPQQGQAPVLPAAVPTKGPAG